MYLDLITFDLMSQFLILDNEAMRAHGTHLLLGWKNVHVLLVTVDSHVK